MANNSTVIGRSTFVRGRVTGEGDLEIAGRVEGDIACSGEVTIDTTALIAANVSGSRIVVRGAVKGDLVAEEAVVVEAGARVVGDLRAPRIAIAQGGLVRGHVETGKAGGPRLRSVAAPARASVTETKARPSAPAAAARPAVKAVPAPAPVVAAKAPAKPARAAGKPAPPPPVVPVLKKGTKAVQKKRA
jgi:cytoskeletal protein CcmA (bactofilin family)